MAENLGLTNRIQQVLANDLLSVAPVADFEYASTQTGSAAAAMFPGFHQDDAPRVDHPTNLAFQQAWRSADNPSLSLNSDIPELQPNDHTDTDMEETLAFGQEAGAAGRPEIVMNQTVNQSCGLMTDQYRSLWSGGGEGEDSSARTYSVSPELQQQIHANPGFSADDRTSTSGTLHSQFPGPRNLNQIRRTNSCGDQYEIQKYRTLYEAQEMHHQWRQQLNSTSELAVNTDATDGQNLPCQESWQRDIITSPNWQIPIANPTDNSKRPTGGTRSNAKLVNQVSKFAGPLLRGQSMSALELLKDVEKYRKEAAAEVFNVPCDVKPGHGMQEPPTPPHVQITRSSPKGHRRSLGVELASSSGRVHAGHDEAAATHMLAERCRRKKQKENFTALRKLVPIISKADKASTLIDAITYLKLLQTQIQKLEASKEDIDQRCAVLEDRCKGLRERNQELVEMLAKDQSPGSGAIQLNLVHLNLKSMNSS